MGLNGGTAHTAEAPDSRVCLSIGELDVLTGGLISLQRSVKGDREGSSVEVSVYVQSGLNVCNVLHIIDHGASVVVSVAVGAHEVAIGAAVVPERTEDDVGASHGILSVTSAEPNTVPAGGRCPRGDIVLNESEGLSEVLDLVSISVSEVISGEGGSKVHVTSGGLHDEVTLGTMGRRDEHSEESGDRDSYGLLHIRYNYINLIK